MPNVYATHPGRRRLLAYSGSQTERDAHRKMPTEEWNVEILSVVRRRV
jgi:hypothetical protein